jgi:hypothetical protein
MLAQVTKDMIDDKVAEWKEAGTRIEVMRRGNRVGCALMPLTLPMLSACTFEHLRRTSPLRMPPSLWR